MQIKPVTPDTIHYNPVSNTFEAVVTLNTADGNYRYPCTVSGPITMPLQAAAFKLVQQAKQRHMTRGDLCAHTTCATDLPQAA